MIDAALSRGPDARSRISLEASHILRDNLAGTLHCVKLCVIFFVTDYSSRRYYRPNDFHNFHKLSYQRERTKSVHANASLSRGLQHTQRELIVIRTSSLELIDASKRGGVPPVGCKYSFGIDQPKRTPERPLHP